MAAAAKIRVLIVDDILESRDNVAKLLSFEPDIEVVGMADGGEQGIELALRLEPDIVLMDINMPGVDGITATSRIAARLPNSAVIMMSVQGEADYLRRSMLAGAREFLSKPFSLDELIQSVRQVHTLAQANRRVVVTGAPDQASAGHTGYGRTKRAKLVTVFGLKGGVGRSTVAANLAVALRNRGDHEVALMDANLLYGDIGVMLNVTDNKTVSDAVKHFATMDRDLVNDILVTHTSGVRVLLAPPNPQAGEQVTLDHVEQILQHVTAMVEYVVVDTRPSFDEITLALLERSDKVILVLSLELPAIKGAKQYLELSDLLGYDNGRILTVLNRATAPAGIPVADVEATLKVPLVAKLPDDPGLTLRAINEGVPFVQSAPNTALAQEIVKLAALVADQGAGAAAEPNGAAVAGGAATAAPTPVTARAGVGRWIPRRKAS